MSREQKERELTREFHRAMWKTAGCLIVGMVGFSLVFFGAVWHFSESDHFDRHFPKYVAEYAALVGDSFGMVNVFVAAMAFFAVVYSIRQTQEQIRIQQEERQESLQEQRATNAINAFSAFQQAVHFLNECDKEDRTIRREFEEYVSYEAASEYILRRIHCMTIRINAFALEENSPIIAPSLGAGVKSIQFSFIGSAITGMVTNVVSEMDRLDELRGDMSNRAVKVHCKEIQTQTSRILELLRRCIVFFYEDEKTAEDLRSVVGRLWETRIMRIQIFDSEGDWQLSRSDVVEVLDIVNEGVSLLFEKDEEYGASAKEICVPASGPLDSSASSSRPASHGPKPEQGKTPDGA